MNQSQINQVKGHIEAFSALDLGGIIASNYGDDADLSTVSIGEYSAKEYCSAIKKYLTNLAKKSIAFTQRQCRSDTSFKTNTAMGI